MAIQHNALPVLEARGANLYLDEFLVMSVCLPPTHPDRARVELALATLIATATARRCPGCGKPVVWRSLGYQHRDESAQESGPGWVRCSYVAQEDHDE